MSPNKDFWFGKRVLVTGGEGFAASHLIKELLKKEAVVVTTIRHNRPLRTLKLLSNDDASPDIENCDLLNYQEIRRICDRHQIDTIYHLAATAIVSDAANSPLSTAENNIIPTLNLLEVARINNIPRVIVASTDKSYGDHATDKLEPLPYKEGYTLRGLDVYSASKVSTDMLAQMYVFQFNLPVAISRACNFFGPGDLNFTRLIPRTIMRLLAGQAPVINLGNEKVLREYMYVDDIISAYLILGERLADYYGPNQSNIPKSGHTIYGWPAFNFGSYTKEETTHLEKCTKIRSVQEVISLLAAKITNIKPVTIEKPANFIEIPDQYLDSSKIRGLGFKPKVEFEEAIDLTLAWYKKNYSLLEKNAYKYLND
ncbi:MAG TPA: NAD-dependent epimerase/dehydratase family protein [Candidatus Paceibacterota bacterium]|nr:NAD-dependent epimerase/dehydratase family protein [Candidatus Paceibacterota bacterium]